MSFSQLAKAASRRTQHACFLHKLHDECGIVVKTFRYRRPGKHWIDGWLKKNWKGASGPVKNVDLWKRLLKAAAPHTVTFTWVKGHDGHPENERCDTLATTAADGTNLLPDPGV